MDPKETKGLIKKFIESPLELAMATATIQKYIKVKGFLLGLVVTATEPRGSFPEQILAAITLNYIASKYWSTAELYANEKNTIKQIALENIVYASQKVAFYLALLAV